MPRRDPTGETATPQARVVSMPLPAWMRRSVSLLCVVAAVVAAASSVVGGAGVLGDAGVPGGVGGVGGAAHAVGAPITLMALAATIVSAACAALRAAADRSERRIWAFAALGLGAALVAGAAWPASPGHRAVAGVAPFQLAFTPFALLVVLRLAARRPAGLSSPGALHWVDGATAGFASTALAAAVLLNPDRSGWPMRRLRTGAMAEGALGSGAAAVLALSVLLQVLITVTALATARAAGRRGDAALRGAGLAAFACVAADLVLGWRGADGAAPGTLLLLTWTAAALAIAAAAVAPPPVASASGDAGGVLPLAAAATSVAVLLASGVVAVAWPASLLATLALATGMLRMALAQRDLRELSRHTAEARTDELTGLANRRSFTEHLERATVTAARLSVLLLDLDGFKDVNDSLGHQAGDELLKVASDRLRQTVGHGGRVARLGGDEFAIIVPDRDELDPEALAERIHARLGEPVEVGGVQVRVGASIGCTHLSEAPAEWVARHAGVSQAASELLRRADVAMYRAKRARCGTTTFAEDVDDASRELMHEIGALHRAVDAGELVLHYQPTIDLRSGTVRGLEALVRWNHPVRGLLLPADFLALVERAQLMPQLTRFALARALADSADWFDRGLGTIPGGLHVSVNVGAADLLDERFPDMVEDLLTRSGQHPHRLTLEVMEDALLSDPERTRRAIERLQGIGLRIALDDYGVGYSSLSHITRLSIDELKLHRSMIASLQSDRRTQAIVSATAGLARTLGIDFVVKGVEREWTRQTLIELGCDYGTGSLFGVARCAVETSRLLQEHASPARRGDGAASDTPQSVG